MQLTDLQISKIEAFVADKEMYGAVRGIILESIYSHGVVEDGKEHNPLINGAFSLVSLAATNPIPDEVIGQQLRAQWAGVNALEAAFRKLEGITAILPDKEVEENTAV